MGIKLNLEGKPLKRFTTNLISENVYYSRNKAIIPTALTVQESLNYDFRMIPVIDRIKKSQRIINHMEITV